MKATIEDISRESGFSCATVSRVITGKNNVKEETRKKIEEVIDRLGYQIPAQKAIESHFQKTVMIVTGDLTNPFYAGLIKNVDECLHKEGYMTILGASDYNPAREEDYIVYAQTQGFVGIIMVTAVETENLKILIRTSPCPIIMVNRYIKSVDVDVVCIDNYRGGYMAVEYLISMGHTKIAHLAGQKNSTASQDRTSGFRDAVKENGLPFTEEAIYYGDLKRSSGYEYGKYYVKHLREYTAVFFGNDLMAAGFADAVLEEGLEIPRDVSIICFDDLLARESNLKFTTISREPSTMGKFAAKILLDRINGTVNEVRKVIYPPKIHIRSSVRNLNSPVLPDHTDHPEDSDKSEIDTDPMILKEEEEEEDHETVRK